MRMWMIDPQELCRHHLLGEHRELHTLVGAIQSEDISIQGWIDDGFVDPHQIEERHAALVEECRRRGWPSGTDHQTPIPEGLPVKCYESVTIDADRARDDLSERCEACRRRMEGDE